MTDKWHWLRHNWTKWEPYNLRYGTGNCDIRQWRACLTCGHLEDKLVAPDAILQAPVTSKWPAVLGQAETTK